MSSFEFFRNIFSEKKNFFILFSFFIFFCFTCANCRKMKYYDCRKTWKVCTASLYKMLIVRKMVVFSQVFLLKRDKRGRVHFFSKLVRVMRISFEYLHICFSILYKVELEFSPQLTIMYKKLFWSNNAAIEHKANRLLTRYNFCNIIFHFLFFCYLFIFLPKKKLFLFNIRVNNSPLPRLRRCGHT